MQRIYTESVKTSETFDTRQALVCYTAVFSVVTQRSPPPPPHQHCVMTLKAAVYQTPQWFPNKCPGA